MPSITTLDECLVQVEADGNAIAGISAVVQIIPIIVVVHVNVIAVVPIVRPVFRPRINQTEPITAVLEAAMSADVHHRETVDAEPMFLSVVAAEAVIRDAVAAVTAALLPSVVLRLPAMGTIPLPSDLLYADLLGAASLCRPVVVLLLSLLPLLILLPSGLLLLLSCSMVLQLTLLPLVILLPVRLLLLLRGVVPLLSLLILLPSGLLLLSCGIVLLTLLPLLILLPVRLLLLLRGVVPLLSLLILLPSGLLLLLSRGIVLLTLLPLLILLPSGLLLLLFRSLSLLLLALLALLILLPSGLLLPFGLGLLLLFLRFGLFVLLLLSCVRRSYSHKEKKRGRTNDSNLFHGVTSIACTGARITRHMGHLNRPVLAFNLSLAESGCLLVTQRGFARGSGTSQKHSRATTPRL